MINYLNSIEDQRKDDDKYDKFQQLQLISYLPVSVNTHSLAQSSSPALYTKLTPP